MMKPVEISDTLREYLEEKYEDGYSRTEAEYIFVEVKGQMYKRLRKADSGYWIPAWS